MAFANSPNSNKKKNQESRWNYCHLLSTYPRNINEPLWLQYYTFCIICQKIFIKKLYIMYNLF